MDGRQADLEVVFGPDGVWAEFLRRAPGYVATEMECESQVERRYRVRDVWSWHRSFELFRERFAVEFEKFERLLFEESVVEREEFAGAYYEERPGDDDELVPE